MQKVIITKAYIYPTMHCNLKCKMCYTKIFRQNDKKLTLDDYKNIISFLYQYGLKVLDISGGEPLLYENLIELLKFVRVEYPTIKVHLVTNGTKLFGCNSDLLYELKQIDKLVISLDSLIDVKHNSVTGISDSYNWTLAGINYVVNQNFLNVGINCILGEFNKNEVTNYLEFCDKYNIRYLNFLKQLNGNTTILKNVKTDEYSYIYNSIKDWVNGKNACTDVGKMNITLSMPAVAFQSNFKNIVGKNRNVTYRVEFDPLMGCHAFSKDIVVLPDGTITGCTALVENKIYHIGQIMDMDRQMFENMYMKMRNRILEKQKDLITKKCSSCKHLAICKGGCPANDNMCEKVE